LRNWIQLCVLILTLAIGLQFSIYVFQALGTGPITVQRPPGVEGFLPIGALMGWKLFITTGFWDPVHPAAMVILGFAGLVSFLLRKSFCGWFCPVGALSEGLWKLGRRVIGRNYRLPPWSDIPLRSIKYLLLSFFVWVIFSMNPETIMAFLEGAYYKISDVKMLYFFKNLSVLSASVLIFLTLMSIPVRNFWCRYACPYGALMGLFALISPTRIYRDPESCIGCGSCSAECPYHLRVDKKLKIVSPECSGCMDCVRSCPVERTLELKTLGFGKWVWSTVSLGLVILCLFTSLVYTARISGHWQTRVPEHEVRMFLRQIDSPAISHPRMDFGKRD